MSGLNDPDAVAREYASLDRLGARRLDRTADVSGDVDPRQVALQAIAEVRPTRVLDAGCGTGAFASLIDASTVTGVDLSPAAARATHDRGLPAAVMDLQRLGLRDGAFDVVVCNWVLYHVPDQELAIRELARVLRPGGRFVGVYNSGRHLAELWAAVGDPWKDDIGFPCERAEERLRPHFSAVELRPATGHATWPDRDSLQRYLDAYREIAGPLVAPEGPYPFRATRKNCVVIADR